MSWGFGEGQTVLQSDEAAYDNYFNVPGVTFVASTGDEGAAAPLYPAFSPDVLAVGGTSLSLNQDGSYNSETGWGNLSNASGPYFASGGGLSQYEAEPAYQQGVQNTGSRTIPDVAFVADPGTGVWIADPYNLGAGNPWEVAGGTSLAAPCWAGLIALANQGRAAARQPVLDSSNPTETLQDLYNLSQSDYHVIASGFNGYNAEPGYNLVTGLGTPVANLLVPDLVTGNFPATGQVAPASAAALVYSGISGGTTINGSGQTMIFTALTVPGSNTANAFRPWGIVGGDGGGAPGTTTAQDLDISELVNVGSQPSKALPPDAGMIFLVEGLDHNFSSNPPTAAQDMVFASLGEQSREMTVSAGNQGMDSLLGDGSNRGWPGQPANMVLSNTGVHERASPLGLDNLFSSWGQEDEVPFLAEF